jgi:hypothetical protein
MSVNLSRVKSALRVVKYFVHGDNHDRDKITGMGRRLFLDITTVTHYRRTGVKQTETFTAHIFRKELRVIVRANGKGDKDESMVEADFAKYANRRWADKAPLVLSLLAKIK